MGNWITIIILTFCALIWSSVSSASQEGDPARGQDLYRACAACHSLAPGRHMTGPSLADIWGHKAGTVDGFARYSEALKGAQNLWDEDTLDAWLANPREYIPGNRMTFRGIPNATDRRDLIAFLRSVSQGGNSSQGEQAQGMPEGTESEGGMLDLKTLEANNRITSIKHCDDTYTVIAENGETYEFWEFNLRIKTDGSELGPVPGRPVIIPASMRGDRAFVIFAAPDEISPFIKSECSQ